MANAANTSREIVNMLFDVIRLYTEQSIEDGLDFATEQINDYIEGLGEEESAEETINE